MGGFCKWHQGFRTDKKPKELRSGTLSSGKDTSSPVKKRNPIKPISDKMAGRLKEYRLLRDKYLKDHPNCEICGNTPVELHHKKPRAYFLTDVSIFMSVCRKCHSRMENEHAWAREKGYKLDHL